MALFKVIYLMDLILCIGIEGAFFERGSPV
ncbi:MAG: hypothetical protein ACJA2U_000916 [Marinomonas primoryensis]